MNRYRSIFLAILILALLSFLFLYKQNRQPKDISNETLGIKEQIAAPTFLLWPLDKAEQRQKLLKFGMYVTPDPKQNPISPPERFTGFHTGLDIEILPEEKDAPVVVKTICEGKILHAGVVEGYGGTIVQECTISNQQISVLYGHMNVKSFRVIKGDKTIPAQTPIAELGKGKTEETGNTRKHLHLGIHKGSHVEFLGYVSNQNDLKEFMDPLPFLQK